MKQRHIHTNETPLFHCKKMSATSAVSDDKIIAALTALLAVNIAGELAEKECKLPGTFRAKFINNLYIINPDIIKKHANFEVLKVQIIFSGGQRTFKRK